MPKDAVGRRVQSVDEIELPGDYCRTPVNDHGTTIDAVFFLLPIARDDGVPPEARSLHQVHQPPHTFRECDDGSLEIRASIGSRALERKDQPPNAVTYIWHGYLDEGHRWRSVG